MEISLIANLRMKQIDSGEHRQQRETRGGGSKAPSFLDSSDCLHCSSAGFSVLTYMIEKSVAVSVRALPIFFQGETWVEGSVKERKTMWCVPLFCIGKK